MAKKPLSPTNDFVFKRIFGENHSILEDFLGSVLDLPTDEYKGLEIVDPSLDQEYSWDKHGVLDVKIHTSSGKVIDVEVQVKHHRSIWKRMLFYTSKMIAGQIKSGHQYDRINSVINILIADFVMIKENNAYHNRFRLYDKNTGADYPDSMEIHVLELPKILELDGTQLGNWMRFFHARTEEELKMAARTSPAIEKACGIIRVLSGSERDRAIAEAREKAQMDMDSMIGDARHEGREEGLQEGVKKGLKKGLKKGRQEGKLEVARNALREGMPVETVVKISGLSLEEVKRLRGGIKNGGPNKLGY